MGDIDFSGSVNQNDSSDTLLSGESITDPGLIEYQFAGASIQNTSGDTTISGSASQANLGADQSISGIETNIGPGDNNYNTYSTTVEQIITYGGTNVYGGTSVSYTNNLGLLAGNYITFSTTADVVTINGDQIGTKADITLLNSYSGTNLSYIGTKAAEFSILSGNNIDVSLVDRDFTVNYTGPTSSGSALGLTAGTGITLGTSGDVVTIYNSLGTAGKILNVVSTTLNTTFAGASNAWADITGMTASIVPQFSNSKVLVMVNLSTGYATNPYDMTCRLMRDASPIGTGAEVASRTLGSFDPMDRGMSVYEQTARGMHYLDSPNTIGTCNYHIEYIVISGGTLLINKTGADTTSDSRCVSSITVMEVGGV